MSIFNGKLRRLGKLTGSLADKKPQLHIKITPLNDGPKATLSPRGTFSGAWARAGKFFSGAARPLFLLYRFLAGSDRILHRYSAKAGTAPAREIEAHSAPQASTAAPLTGQPAQEIAVHSRPRASVWAQLAAYNRAAAAYLASIAMGRRARPAAAPGVLAKYRKRMDLERTSKAEAAGSAIIESRFNTAKNGVVAAAIPAAAACAKFAEETPSGKTAKAETADSIGVNVNRALPHSYSAAPYTWFLSEYTDGTLHIFQAVSGVQSGNSVEIDTETESVYWANAFVRDGVANLVFAQTEPQTGGELELI